MPDFHRTPNFWVGLDVHKDSVTAAVFRDRDPESMCVDRLPNDLKEIRRYFKRLQADGLARARSVGLWRRLPAGRYPTSARPPKAASA